jgi:hypothetical protein
VPARPSHRGVDARSVARRLAPDVRFGAGAQTSPDRPLAGLVEECVEGSVDRLLGERPLVELEREAGRPPVRISADGDQRFRSKPITGFAGSRSPVSREGDHPFR